VEDVTDATFEEVVLQAHVPVVVDFWAPWCKPCDAIEPHLRSLAEEWDGRARFVRMNVDENLAVPSRYGVLSLPTVTVFVGGEAVETVHGAHRRERYEGALSHHVAR
jgi:thioredoxin 1